MKRVGQKFAISWSKRYLVCFVINNINIFSKIKKAIIMAKGPFTRLPIWPIDQALGQQYGQIIDLV